MSELYKILIDLSLNFNPDKEILNRTELLKTAKMADHLTVVIAKNQISEKCLYISEIQTRSTNVRPKITVEQYNTVEQKKASF